MSRAAWMGALALTVCVGCRPPVAPKVGPAIPQDCPEPPPAMSVTEAAGELARFARETRANLMARLEPSPEGHEELFATLHPPGLSLLEAALASPGEAQRLDPVWMQSHLLTAHVELHARQPLTGLAEGDVQGVVLQDEQGRRSDALYMTVRRHSGGLSYRFFFDPLFFDREQDRSKVSFHLPLGARGPHPDCGRARGTEGCAKTLTARWRLSHGTLAGMDDLPLLFWMSRERGVRLGRWALLIGDREEARAVLSDELSCAPDLDAARQLLQGMRRSVRSLPPERHKVTVPRLPERTRVELGHDPVRDIGLRAAMLARLTPLAGPGVVAPAMVRRAQQALRQAVRALEKGDVGWSIASQLTDFDRALAGLLADALDGKRARGEVLPTLALQGIAEIPEQAVTEELGLRVLHANYDLVPKWVKGPKGFTMADGTVSRVQLLELKPVVRGEHVVAMLHRRLGWGWIHPGLPPERVQVSFVDRSADYWRGQVAELPARAPLEALQPLARQLLERELHSPSASAAALAMAGLLELKAPGALDRVLDLLERGPRALRGVVLDAVAASREPRVSQVIAAAARSPDAELRAGAMRALGQRGEEPRLLRAGLTDASPEVSAAALEGLLRVGDASGLVQARRWLADSVRRDRLLRWIATAPPSVKLGALATELTRLARQPSPSRELPAALVRVLGDRAAPHLNRLYTGAAGLSTWIVQSAVGAAFEPLLRRAVAEGPPEARSVAALGLARQKSPPEGLLKGLIGDKDPRVRLAAHVGLARMGQAGSLLALGQWARGGCWERRAVLPVLCRSMEATSRARLLVDALDAGCPNLRPEAWDLALHYQPRDLVVLRAALGHGRRAQRVQAALAVLGLHRPSIPRSSLTSLR